VLLKRLPHKELRHAHDDRLCHGPREDDQGNGATLVIPGSHLWGPDRCPQNEEAIPAELNPGDALIFVGNTYHAGGGNTTKYVIYNPLPPNPSPFSTSADLCVRAISTEMSTERL
jgi:hypothetical protein